MNTFQIGCKRSVESLVSLFMWNLPFLLFSPFSSPSLSPISLWPSPLPLSSHALPSFEFLLCWELGWTLSKGVQQMEVLWSQHMLALLERCRAEYTASHLGRSPVTYQGNMSFMCMLSVEGKWYQSGSHQWVVSLRTHKYWGTHKYLVSYKYLALLGSFITLYLHVAHTSSTFPLSDISRGTNLMIYSKYGFWILYLINALLTYPTFLICFLLMNYLLNIYEFHPSSLFSVGSP